MVFKILETYFQKFSNNTREVQWKQWVKKSHKNWISLQNYVIKNFNSVLKLIAVIYIKIFVIFE